MARGKATLSADEARRAHTLYMSGKTLAQTGEQFGLPAGTLRSIFVRLGLSIRARGYRLKATIAEDTDDDAILSFKATWDQLDSAVKGSIAESYTKSRLAELGFDVWEPATQNHRTDLLVLVGQSALRIQVKNATYDADRRRFRVNLHRRGRGRRFTTYDGADVDFFIVFCAGLPTLEFYIIPAELVGGAPSINMLPHRTRRANFAVFSWEAYRNAFHLLEKPDEAPAATRPVLRGRRRRNGLPSSGV